MINVEIVIIGNEVLLGQTLDTNSGYLCRVVRGRGGRVGHVAIVRDELSSIAEEVQASLRRRAELIFTCGGLGPTDDDLTLAGVSAATARRLELNPPARQFVERRYNELAMAGFVASGTMNEDRLKMARLPSGGLAIDNPVGAAPAVALMLEGSRVICLPGVPSELKAIVEGPLRPLLDEVFGPGSYLEREVIVNCGDESQIAAVLRAVAAAHPAVYVKSHASHFGADVRFRITLSASASTTKDAYRAVEDTLADMIRSFREDGIESAERPIADA